MPLSGKTTVADLMEEKGYTVLDMGEVVRIEMGKRGIEPGNEGEFVNSMRDKHGMNAIAQLSVPYLEEIIYENEKIMITGMRGWEEKERFEQETGEEINIIAVWSSRKTRRQRREKRQRKEDVEGQKFEERDWRELGNGIGNMMALSDHLIKNEGTLEELEEKVKHIGI
ncbi:MAG: dephospho-CoA kinase [Nanohaloarchaea archaeon SW_7_43_1]|nr:MAG: dephospho-CoA kinase [Nanohaloarchaea archaeon SW_7_43_1]